MAFKELAILYNPKVSTALPYFQLPRWRGTDDLKDAQADLLELQNGLATIPDKLAERGLSIEDVLADVDNRKALEEMGIILTSAQSNPSMNQTTNTQPNSNSTNT
jgi:capsid protein